MLVGMKRWAGLRNEAGTKPGRRAVRSVAGRHGVRNDPDAWGAELRAGWRDSCEGGFFPEVRLRADLADQP